MSTSAVLMDLPMAIQCTIRTAPTMHLLRKSHRKCPTPCSLPFTDCRASLCCRSHAADVGGNREQYACMRRPQLYYAECNPIQRTTCSTDAGRAGTEWLCPGWEQCGGAGEECTLSRCCSDPGMGCFLNSTLRSEGGGWHAFCLPATHGTGRGDRNRDGVQQLHQVRPGEELALFDSTSANMTDEEYFYLEVSNNHAFCEDTPQWRCIEAWRAGSVDANRLARSFMRSSGLEPAMIAGLAVGGVLLACCVIVFGLIYRRRMHDQLRNLEAELAEFRQAKRTADEKRRGGEHVLPLTSSTDAVSDTGLASPRDVHP